MSASAENKPGTLSPVRAREILVQIVKEARAKGYYQIDDVIRYLAIIKRRSGNVRVRGDITAYVAGIYDQTSTETYHFGYRAKAPKPSGPQQPIERAKNGS